MSGAIRSLLRSIIDYAGLFPPAELDMCAAVTNYANCLAGDYAWMLGRFVVSVARLAEFESIVQTTSALSTDPASLQATTGSYASWRLSVLAGADLPSDLLSIEEFNRRPAVQQVTRPHSNRPQRIEGTTPLVIDTIELKAMSQAEIVAAMQRMPSGVSVYFELPVSSDETLMQAARSAGARVKVRTGGDTPQAFPSCAQLAEFLVRCARVGVAFKATAGLHHPVRSVQRLTYSDNSPTGTMHGFLNVFLAASGVRAGMSSDEAARLLEETSPAAFQFDDDGASWRGHHWSISHLRAARQEFAISFGSCSFQEPIDHLSALGLFNS